MNGECRAFHLFKFERAWRHLKEVHAYEVNEEEKLWTYGELWDFHKSLTEEVK